MEEYISKEKIKGFVRSGISTDTEADKEYVCSFIDSIPPADVRENIHAAWEDTADPIDSRWGRKYYQCPKCSKRADYFMSGSEDWWCVDKPNFCPSCGAIMDGEPKGLTAKVGIVGKPSLLNQIPIGEKGET